MTTGITMPYRTAPEGSVVGGEWEMGSGDRWVVLPDSHDTWDYATDIALRRIVTVEATTVRSICGLEGARLALVTAWKSCHGRARGAAAVVDIAPSIGRTRATIQFTLAGADLGGDLGLETVLVLADEVCPQPLAAHLPGSVLWRDQAVLTLEGIGSRFPCEALPFSESPSLPNGAVWYLDWSPDALEEDTLASLRLYINTEHPAGRHIITPGESVPSRIIASTLRLELARHLIFEALGRDEFVGRDDFEPGTVGSSIDLLIRQYWPGESKTSVGYRRQRNPQRLEAELQDHLRFLEDIGLD